MLLKNNGYDFKFVKREEEVQTPDICILNTRRPVSVEVKLKKSTTKLTKDTIRDALEGARDQLPENDPGVVFLKVPQNWIDNNTGVLSVLPPMAEVAEEFLRNTERVVSVIYYVYYIAIGGEITKMTVVYKEQFNAVTRFGAGRDWQLLPDRPAQPPSPQGWRNWLPVQSFVMERFR
jgi:hypothetical protein